MLARRLAPALLGMGLVACAAPPPGGDPLVLVPVAPPAAPLVAVPLRLERLSLAGVRRGAEVGRYVFGITCAAPYGRVLWTASRFGDGRTLAGPVARALEESGFTVESPDRDDPPAAVAPALRVTGEIVAARMELCRKKNWLTGNPEGDSGTAEVRVTWTLSGPHGPVLRAATLGRAEVDTTPESDAVLLENAVADAAGALGGDPAFRSVLTARAAALPPPLSAAPRLERPPPKRTPGHGAAVAGAVVAVGDGRGVVVGSIDGRPVLVAAGTGAAAEVAVRLNGQSAPGVVERAAAELGLILVRLAQAPAVAPPALPLSSRRPAVSDPLRAATGGGDRGVAGLLAGRQEGQGGQTPLLLADFPGSPLPPATPILDQMDNLIGFTVAVPGPEGLSVVAPAAGALAALGLGQDAGP